MPEFISLNIEYLFYQIYKFYFAISHATPSAPDFSIFDLYTSSIFFFISLAVTLILAWVIIYLLIKTHQLHAAVEWKLYNQMQERKAVHEENPKWKSVTSFMESTSQNDWKVAVIEADKMLDEALFNSGFQGENLGDRLKGIDPKSVPWLNDAWEAHKIRNRIAHEADFVLDQREARKAVAKYEGALRAMRAI